MAQSGFLVFDTTMKTSGAALGAWIGVSPASASAYGREETYLAQSYWKPQEATEHVSGVRALDLPTEGVVFFHNTIVGTPSYVSVITTSAESVEYAFHQPGTILGKAFRLRDLEPPVVPLRADTWIMPGWEPASLLPTEFGSAIASIEQVITDIGLARPIVRSTNLMGLAERVAATRSPRPRGLEGWARSLAEDVKDAND